ncbi:MAG: hypothetical protein HYR98_01335 [Nitrospirae bacterium]|nr:hypothetical protein [Nitrospirota bacterium]
MEPFGLPGSFWSAIATAYWRAPCYVRLFLAGIVAFVVSDNVFLWTVSGYRKGSSLYELGIVYPSAFFSPAAFRIFGIAIEGIEIVFRLVRYPTPADIWGMAYAYWVHVAIVVGTLVIPAHHLPLIRYKAQENGTVALDTVEKSRRYWGGEQSAQFFETMKDKSFHKRFYRSYLPWAFAMVVVAALLAFVAYFMVSRGVPVGEIWDSLLAVGAVLFVLMVAFRIWLMRRD